MEDIRLEDLHGDPERGDGSTGILVRARRGEHWCSMDIGELDRDSLMRWLRSRGGENPWAENVVLIMLGHKAEQPK
jgi:hypothetical protein